MSNLYPLRFLYIQTTIRPLQMSSLFPHPLPAWIWPESMLCPIILLFFCFQFLTSSKKMSFVWVVPRCCLATALSSKKTTLAVLPWTMCELSECKGFLSRLLNTSALRFSALRFTVLTLPYSLSYTHSHTAHTLLHYSLYSRNRTQSHNPRLHFLN